MWHSDACTHIWETIYLEAHPAIRQICFNETMQVDNVSCKCIEFPPLEVEQSTPLPPSVCNAVRKTCYWSGPCSFPCAVGLIDADRAQKHGMDEFISANPCSFDHASLFEMVQRLTLDHRLNDTFCSLVCDNRIEFTKKEGKKQQPLNRIIGQSCETSRNSEWSITVMCFNMFVGVCAGMVQSGTGVCPGWVLRPERSARLSQTPGLPAGPPGESRTRGHYWSHSPSLQLCVLCLPCPWEQVGPDLSLQLDWNSFCIHITIIADKPFLYARFMWESSILKHNQG